MDALAGGWPFVLPLPLVEEHDLQRVEVRGQDEQVIECAPAQDTHEIVADLGRQRFRLGEDYSEELFLVFEEKLDPFGTGPSLATIIPPYRRSRRLSAGFEEGRSSPILSGSW
jgi:hypothetical protein